MANINIRDFEYNPGVMRGPYPPPYPTEPKPPSNNTGGGLPKLPGQPQAPSQPTTYPNLQQPSNPPNSAYVPSFNPPRNPTDWTVPGVSDGMNWWTGIAGDYNRWNMDSWLAEWNARQNMFNMGQSNAALQSDYYNNLNNLDYNSWASLLGAGSDAYRSQAELYGNLQNSAGNTYANIYGSDANLAGNMYGTNINAMNNWYTSAAQNQTQKEIAAMQAFGRDQTPNVRNMQNWT